MFLLTVYDLQENEHSSTYYVENDRMYFDAEADAMAYASDNGYLDGDFSVSLEDDQGTKRYL